MSKKKISSNHILLTFVDNKLTVTNKCSHKVNLSFAFDDYHIELPVNGNSTISKTQKELEEIKAK